MKSLTVLYCLFLCLSSLSLVSLSWAPIGAVWHYEQADFKPPVFDDYIRIEAMRDTIINGYAAIVLNEISYYHYGTLMSTQEYVMRSEGEKVFYWSDEIDQFLMLYDFGAQAGDTIEIVCRVGEDTTLNVVIDSVDIFEINGVSLRRQYTTQLDIFNDCSLILGRSSKGSAT